MSAALPAIRRLENRSFVFTRVLALVLRPALSVTVNVTTYFVGTPPAAENVCAGLACVLTGVPSPKFHE